MNHSTIHIPLMIAAVALLGGCQAMPWLMTAFAPPEKVEALYEPAKTSKLLVWVEDHPGQALAAGSVRYHLTKELNDQLLANEVVDEVIGHNEIIRVQMDDPTFDSYTAAEVAEIVGADLVLRVEVTEFSLKDTELNPLWNGRLATRIQILDASGEILWPEDRLYGHPVRPVEKKTTNEVSAAYGTKLTHWMAALEAEHIARLLYDHEIDPVEAGRERRREASEMAGLSFD